MLIPTPDEMDRIARERFGVDYLYPIQRFVVSNVLEGNPQIVVLPTGAGKSLCFLLPSLLLDGPSLVIVPLLALLADQERKLRALGVPLGILRGAMEASEKLRLWEDLRHGRTRLLLATLESCLVPSNLAALRDCAIRHLVVDEAHCICEWGDTFRPAYLRVGALVYGLGVRMVSAFTATASRDVILRIRAALFPEGGVRIVGENADRPGISYSVRPVLGTHARNGLVRATERPLLVFCRTRGESELAARTARRLLGHRAVFFYHAGLSREERARVEAWFLGSPDGALFATCAYGMGVDKPDIRTIVHTHLPGSVEAYLQESGRAGRDGKAARAVLLYDASAEEARRRWMTEERERVRFERMLSYARRRDACRRAVLLSLIGQDPVACSGCDVCDGAAEGRAEGESLILWFTRRYRRRFTPAQAAQILCGTRGPRAARDFHDCLPGAGALEGWTPDEAEEALGALAGRGGVRLLRWGPWKGRLHVPRAPC